MRLPKDMMRDPNVTQERMDGVIPTEERVQTRFEDIAIPVTPRGKLAAQDAAFFENGRRPAGVG